MMKHYKKYLIGQDDQFNPVNFPSVTEEIELINKETNTLPSPGKTEIIISFLKNRSINVKLATANPELSALVTSNTLFTGSIEDLFDSCRHNLSFLREFEAHLKQMLDEEVRQHRA